MTENTENTENNENNENNVMTLPIAEGNLMNAKSDALDSLIERRYRFIGSDDFPRLAVRLLEEHEKGDY